MKILYGVLALWCLACTLPAEEEMGKARGGKGDTAVDSMLLNFDFGGELRIPLTTWIPSHEAAIRKQLKYLRGQLSARRINGAWQDIAISDIGVQYEGNDQIVSYRATFLVSWGAAWEGKRFYKLILPKFFQSCQENEVEPSFYDKYGDSCAEARDDGGTYRERCRNFGPSFVPDKRLCQLADEDIFTTYALVSMRDEKGGSSYPEYHKIWEDDVFRAVVIIGLDDTDSLGDVSYFDSGFFAYREFTRKLEDTLSNHEHSVSGENIPVSFSSWFRAPDRTFTVNLDGRRRAEISVLMVRELANPGWDFYQRYNVLAREADLIAYSGHSRDGANYDYLAYVNWRPSQYVIVFNDGCYTLQLSAQSLVARHQAVNVDDEFGTKYLDLMVNTVQARWHYAAENLMVLVDAFLNTESLQSYEQILGEMPDHPMIVVRGDEDNVFHP